MAEGTEVGTAYVSILPSAAGFGAKLQSQITGEAGRAGSAAGQALGAGITGQASSIATKVAGVFAAVGAARFLKGSIAEAEDAARVGRLTEAVIRSTGGAAGVTADEVEKLAGSLSRVAGVDDEVIQGAENVLLTFTRVGKSIFPAATKAALDMSAALGSDLQGSVIQLGKALNDPLQGMTALSRVGVSFTTQQKEQIKALQQSGDLLGAQKIILAEVNREFGGAAAAGATATQKLSVAVGNLEESLGTMLLPAVEAGAGALERLLGVFTELPGPAQGVTSALVVIGGGIAATSLAVGLLAPKIRLARTELQSLGLAGRAAGTSLAITGRALGLAGLALGLHELGGAIQQALVGTTSVGKLGQAITAFAKQGAADGELLKRFGGDIDSIAGSLSGVKYGRRTGTVGEAFDNFVNGLTGHADDLVKSKERLNALDDALADMVSGGKADAAKAFVDQLTAALRAQGANVPEIIGGLDDYRLALTNTGQAAAGAGQAVELSAEQIAAADAKIAESAKEWDDLHSKLEDIVQSDWSQQLASNLTSALNPLERFVVGTGANIDDLRASVTDAAADLADAKAEVARLQGTKISDPVEKFLSKGTEATAAQIDAAQAKVDKAAKALAASQKELVAAQKSPLATIRDNLTSNLAGITRWLDNIDKLAAGGHESLARHLTQLGPQAADAVAEAVGVAPKQLDKIQGLFDRADAKIAEAASGAFELNLAQAAKPGETLAEIIAKRYEASLIPKFTQATLSALNQATAAILGAEGQGIPGFGEEPGPGEARKPVPALTGAQATPTAVPTASKNVTVVLNGQTPDPTLLGKAIAWEI